MSKQNAQASNSPEFKRTMENIHQSACLRGPIRGMTRGFHLGHSGEDIVAHPGAGNINSRDRGDLTDSMVANRGGENTVSRDHRGDGSIDSLYNHGGGNGLHASRSRIF
jgi:hypothetical protein